MRKKNIFAGDFILARLFNRAAKRSRNRAALLCRDIEPRVQRRFARKGSSRLPNGELILPLTGIYALTVV